MAGANESIVQEFMAECDEITGRLNAGLLEIERGSHTEETLASIYRDVHSLKGSAHLLGFSALGDLAHVMESTLDPVRRKEMQPGRRLIEALYRGMDVIEHMAQEIREGKALGEKYDVELRETIARLIEASLNSVGGNMTLPNDTHRLTEQLEMGAPQASIATPITEVSLPPAAPALVTVPTAPGSEATSGEASGTIRVSVPLLDKLMALMGEMVLVRNQVLQYSSKSDDLEFLNLSQRLDVVTSEIQGEMMKTRMQPIGNVLTKFQRLVRDLSRELGKRVELSLHGMETELDKTLLEAIKDPLSHILRNSCDHGIEMPDVRRKAGKDEVGRVTVRAYHEGGQVIVEISDDGRGLNREKLLAKAIDKNLVASDKAAGMSDRDVFNLIFAPGFSTAAAVTNVSGRGVGMDVVKSNIEKIGGVVELTSQTGRNMTIRLKIPLTLAIVPALVVRGGEDRYAIPQVKLVELVRAERSSDGNQIEFIQGQPVYRLRGNLLPLVDLKGVLGSSGQIAQSAEVVNIVVLNGDRQLFGLIVDEILDTADIVVKPLSRFLKALDVYSGATVLGDGSVALILDVAGIAERQHLVSDKNLEQKSRDRRTQESRARTDDLEEFLLFRLDTPTKCAMLLKQVHRLEEFRADAIELSGAQRVVRYRDTVLPIISLNETLGFTTKSEATRGSRPDVISTVVIERGDHFFGIEVNEILDVMSTDASLDATVSDRPGILGNIVTGEQVVVVIDLQTVLERSGPNCKRVAAQFNTHPGAVASSLPSQTKSCESSGGSNERNAKLRVLLAEDSAFIRKHVTKTLETAGFTVTGFANGALALERLESEPDGTFDLILSDIEMPILGGIGFATGVRKNPRFAELPMLALTTRVNLASVDAGRKAGFDFYLEKLDPVELLNALGMAMKHKRAS